MAAINRFKEFYVVTFYIDFQIFQYIKTVGLFEICLLLPHCTITKYPYCKLQVAGESFLNAIHCSQRISVFGTLYLEFSLFPIRKNTFNSLPIKPITIFREVLVRMFKLFYIRTIEFKIQIFPKIDGHCLTPTVQSLYPTVNPLYIHCTEQQYISVLRWTALYLPIDQHCTPRYTTVHCPDQHCTSPYTTVHGPDQHCTSLYTTVQGTEKHRTPL